MENLLALELPSVKQKLLCQYVGFFKKIRSSCSKEVRILSEIVAIDAQIVTGRNLLNIEHEYLLNPWIEPVKMFKEVNIKRATPPLMSLGLDS